MLYEGTQRDEHSSLAKEFTTSRMRETVAWCRELFGGNGIVLDYGVTKYFADAEATYSYEGTREMNTLIAGRAITGKAAFVQLRWSSRSPATASRPCPREPLPPLASV